MLSKISQYNSRVLAISLDKSDLINFSKSGTLEKCIESHNEIEAANNDEIIYISDDEILLAKEIIGFIKPLERNLIVKDFTPTEYLRTEISDIVNIDKIKNKAALIAAEHSGLIRDISQGFRIYLKRLVDEENNIGIQLFLDLKLIDKD